MKKKQILAFCYFLFYCSFLSFDADAKVWRVNNNSGISADFIQIWQAVNSPSVLNGDTLYVEGSATNYDYAVLTKRLVLIGTGYLLSGTGSNPGLQYNPFTAHAAVLDIDSLASGSAFIGFSANFRIDSGTDDLKFIRSSTYIEPRNVSANSTARNWVIEKCLLGTGSINFRIENIIITNCIARNSVVIPNTINGLFRNNVFVLSLSTSNSYIANNVFLNSINAINSTVKYNISNSANLPAGNNNLLNIPEANIFVGTGSIDGRYQLRSSSPAIGAGEPINGVTPDIGPFGTADPYRLSGIPPIPTIYTLNVPSSVPATSTTMNISFSTRSNN